MVRRSMPLSIALAALMTVPAGAALNTGTRAPLFSAPATLGGKVFTFSLASALARGPVVLYFYPAAFTPGCTMEAHDFADHIANYRALGATVIGVSMDDLPKLQKFSVSECRSKFAVASDATRKISREYDAVIADGLAIYSNRTSYVIAPDGRVVYSYTSLDFHQHVANTLSALRKLRAASASRSRPHRAR